MLEMIGHAIGNYYLIKLIIERISIDIIET